MAFRCALALGAVLSAAQEPLQALVADDECSGGCMLNALQLCGAKLLADAELNSTGGCQKYGCHGGFRSWLPCQCTRSCVKHLNCCSDYAASCLRRHSQAPAERHDGHTLCFARPENYSLVWKAEGADFFENFTFVTEDETHGAQKYLTREEAQRHGLATVSEDGAAVIRVGRVVPSSAPNAPYKRQSVMLHSNRAWVPSQGMLVVMKYNHVPYGASVWPAFWLMNSDVHWPDGGEFDILEYANDEVSKVTFHTNKNCYLNRHKLGLCMAQKRMGGSGPSNCHTNYFRNLLGCRPRQVQRSGEWYAKNPGVMAAAWDAEGVTVYHIPLAELPADLESDAPAPNTWGQWAIAYLPFDSRTCYNVAKPQEIVLNIALCGDWAGHAWFRSRAARRTGFVRGCVANIGRPTMDCCTQFATSRNVRMENYFRHRAYFSIDYVKVYSPEGLHLPPLMSGIFKRGGVPLRR